MPGGDELRECRRFIYRRRRCSRPRRQEAPRGVSPFGSRRQSTRRRPALEGFDLRRATVLPVRPLPTPRSGSCCATSCPSRGRPLKVGVRPTAFGRRLQKGVAMGLFRFLARPDDRGCSSSATARRSSSAGSAAGPEGTGVLRAVGLRPGRGTRWPRAPPRPAGGLLFALGAATPLAAAALSGSMITAIKTVHWEKGVWSTAAATSTTSSCSRRSSA